MAVSRPRSRSAVDRGADPAPRPATLLGAAALVPLGGAVLLAAALLPWGSRTALGIALVVLGVSLHGQRGSGFGGRIGPALTGAFTALLTFGGTLLVAGAVVARLDRDALAGPSGSTPVVVSLVVLVALAVAAAASVRRSPALGLVATSIAGGLASAVALAGLLDAPSGRVGAVLLVVGTAALAVAWDPRAARRPGVRRAALLVAAVVATLVSDALILVVPQVADLLPVDLVVGHDQTGRIAWGLLLVAATLLAAGVLLLAAVRRDAVAGVLAGVTLVGGSAYTSGGARAIVVVLPLLVLAVVLAAIVRPGARAVALRLVPSEGRPGVDIDALAATAAVALGWLALHATDVVAGPARLTGAIALLLVVAVLGVGRRLGGTAGRAAAITGAVVLFQASPWWRLIGGDGVPDQGATWAAAVASVATAAAVGWLLLRPGRPAGPAVVAAVSWLLASTLSVAVEAILEYGVAGVSEDVIAPLAYVALPAVLLVAVAAVALVGPGRRTAEAQAAGAVLAFAAGTAVARYGAFAIDAGGDDVQLVTVLSAVVLLLGLPLLAASTARRRSVAVVLGGGSGVLAAALLLGAGGGPDESRRQGVVRAGDVLFGAALHDSPLAAASAAWPVLLGVMGTALLLVAVALEQTRPLPAGASLGRR